MDKTFEIKIKTRYQVIQNISPINIGIQNIVILFETIDLQYLYMNKPSRWNYEIY